MKVNFKLTVLTSVIAFVLSFFTALISHADFLRSLLRGGILAVIFGALSVGITFLYNKFLSDGSSGETSAYDGQNPAPIGNKVDITIDDAELQEEENTPKFVLTGQNQMLNKDDLGERKTVQLDNINEETVEPLAESEFVMIVELKGKMVERVYGVPVENVEEIVFEGRQTRADELVKAKNRDELLKNFGAVKIWKNGEKNVK